MAKEESFYNKHKDKINTAGLALNALQNQRIQENQVSLGRIQAENARLQKERNELLKKEIEEREARQKKQYKLLKLGSKLKSFVEEIEKEASKNNDNLEIDLYISKHCLKYLEENDEYVNDINFLTFLSDLNSKIQELENKLSERSNNFLLKLKILKGLLKQSEEIIKDIDYLKSLSIDELLNNDSSAEEIVEKFESVKRRVDTLEKLKNELSIFLAKEPYKKLSKINFIELDIKREIFPIGEKSAKNLEKHLQTIISEEYLNDLYNSVKKLISDYKKIENIKSDLSEVNESHNIEELIKQVKGISYENRRTLYPDLKNYKGRIESLLSPNELAPKPRKLDSLNKLIRGEIIEEQNIKSYKRAYKNEVANRVRKNVIYTLLFGSIMFVTLFVFSPLESIAVLIITVLSMIPLAIFSTATAKRDAIKRDEIQEFEYIKPLFDAVRKYVDDLNSIVNK